jgi:hypothetical protein
MTVDTDSIEEQYAETDRKIRTRADVGRQNRRHFRDRTVRIPRQAIRGWERQ